MAKEYFSATDQFPTITVLFSAPDTLAGTSWRGTIPLGLLSLDGRAEQSAIISGVFAARFGGASVPEGVSLRLLANAHGADYEAGFDARQTPLGSIGFEVAFEASFAGMADVPLTFTVAGLASDGPALADVELPTIAANTTDLTLKDVQGGGLPFHSVAVPGGGFGTTVISGQETITDLSIGSATEITVDHSGQALYQTCEYPRVVAPVGVRVTVLASGIGADSTSEGQFVLLVENVSHAGDGGYGTGTPDVTLDWTRMGVVS